MNSTNNEKWRLGMQTQPVSTGLTYVPKLVPLDADGFARSFAVEEVVGLKSFFAEFGFVVVRDVLTEDERVATVDGIWATIEGFCGGKLGLDRNDPRTWCKRWPGGGPGLLGKATTPAAWRNRANPNLRAAFEAVLSRQDLLASVDNFGVLRPTKAVPMRRLPAQTPCRTDVEVATLVDDSLAEHLHLPAVTPSMAAATTSATTTAATTAAGEESAVHDMAAWKTKSKWLHWDLNPFRWAAGTMPPYEFSEYAWISENNGAPLGTAEFKASPECLTATHF